jgi:putative endonuclease
MTKIDNKKKGDRAEEAACAYLRAKGHRIAARNYRCRAGEVDIISWCGATLVFSEVKYRRNLSYGRPAEAVDFRKQQKIIRTAQWYINACGIGETDVRFDVIELLGETDALRVHHIENAFGMA